MQNAGAHAAASYAISDGLSHLPRDTYIADYNYGLLNDVDSLLVSLLSWFSAFIVGKSIQRGFVFFAVLPALRTFALDQPWISKLTIGVWHSRKLNKLLFLKIKLNLSFLLKNLLKYSM